jgi:hypothetical protein
MRVLSVALLLVACTSSSFSAGQAQRNIKDIPGARESLLRIVSPKFYRSLLVSPVEGWIVVRGSLAGTHLFGPRIIHSELNGAYDSLALQLASNLEVMGLAPAETRQPPNVVLHVLIYQIADGKLALSFAHSDETGGTQMRYYGAAWMAVKKKNNTWVTIEPLQLAPSERRGPLSYTLLVESASARMGLPRAIGTFRPSAR